MSNYCINCKFASYWNEAELYCSQLEFSVEKFEPTCMLFEEKFTVEQKKLLEMAKRIMEEDRELLLKLAKM